MSSIIKSELLNKEAQSLSTRMKNLIRYMHTHLLSSIVSSLNINGKIMIKFHISHAVSYSLKFDPYMILIGCWFMAFSGLDCLRVGLLMLIFLNARLFSLTKTSKISEIITSTAKLSNISRAISDGRLSNTWKLFDSLRQKLFLIPYAEAIPKSFSSCSIL